MSNPANKNTSATENAESSAGDYYADPNQYYYGYDYSGTTEEGYNYDSSQYYYDPNYYSQYYSSNTTTTSSSNALPTITPSSAYNSAIQASIYNMPQSNYNNGNKPTVPVSTSGYTGPNAKTEPEEKKKGKKKSIVRTAGGETWEDPSLQDWDENDFRLFAGDLGNEVTDELLYKAFSKYPSLQRTRVVRDKRTAKSKGYGFISFKDPNDFVKAWREMNGKYVGNRPIKLRKSSWKERNSDVRARKERERLGPYPKIR
ncbi:hypothetical protein BJV82DRAFT_517835 [Fennellomyces sp. T-0311]|nr:hypothetical protein BJV82DRAFT_517835 [Fennellomyces sp. T-0311]